MMRTNSRRWAPFIKQILPIFSVTIELSMDTVNILAQQVVGFVCRVEISPQIVTTLNSHGRANGYFHNTLRITQRKSPASAGFSFDTGHKDTKMLRRYTHLRAEDLVERLG